MNEPGAATFTKTPPLKRTAALILVLGILASCKKDDRGTELFAATPETRPVTPVIAELSGLTASKKAPAFLWGLEDSGNPARLFLIRSTGAVAREISVTGASNRDWEDIAQVGTELYIAETGDNNGVYTDYRILILTEPDSTQATAAVTRSIVFTYPDGPHDVEAILPDAASGAIYLITKREATARIYKLTPPFAATNIAQPAGNLTYTGVTSAAVSPDGTELLVRTYTDLHYYRREGSESFEAALAHMPRTLPIVLEPQGEAVCFAGDNSGFYTGSERGLGTTVNLQFYRRR